MKGPQRKTNDYDVVGAYMLIAEWMNDKSAQRDSNTARWV